MKTKIAACIVALSSSAALAQPAPIDGPNCYAAPPGSDALTEFCFVAACIVFRKEYNECTSMACRIVATSNYYDELYWCLYDVARSPQMTVSDLSEMFIGERVPDDLFSVSLPVYAFGGKSPLLLGIGLGGEESDPVPDGVIVLSDGTWYEPPSED
ncbi:MAG: hypothetical protein KC996_08150 [Phycisphaerales bacterium]|nr:hypothetical protein [Phycisphaerales bacterium]